MAEPVITTGALLLGTTKAAVAMVPAIGIIMASSVLAAYASTKFVVWVDERLEARQLKRRGLDGQKGLNRYQQYLLEKEKGLTPHEAFAAATEKMAAAERVVNQVVDMLKTSVSVPVPHPIAAPTAP